MPRIASCRAKNSQLPYKRTMASTIKAIRGKDAKPREIMHEIINERGGIESIGSSGEYRRNQSQIYHTRNNNNLVRNNANQLNDPLLQLLQISKDQQLGNKADWFVRGDMNIWNEQTIFLANEQQLLDIE